MGHRHFLNLTGWHEDFLNSTGRHLGFLESTCRIRTPPPPPVKGPRLGGLQLGSPRVGRGAAAYLLQWPWGPGPTCQWTELHGKPLIQRRGPASGLSAYEGRGMTNTASFSSGVYLALLQSGRGISVGQLVRNYQLGCRCGGVVGVEVVVWGVGVGFFLDFT